MSQRTGHKIRRPRFHLWGPNPYGGSLHTSDPLQVQVALSHGWTVVRVRMLPADSTRLAELIRSERIS